MRDYPTVSNVFRINSSSSILLDDHHHNHHQQQHQQHKLTSTLKNNSGSGGGVGEQLRHYANGDINLNQHQHNSGRDSVYSVNASCDDNNGGSGDSDAIDERRNSCSFIDAITSIGGTGAANVVADNNNRYHSILNVNPCLRDDRFPGTTISPILSASINGAAHFPRRNNYALWIATPVAARYVVGGYCLVYPYLNVYN